MKINWGTSVVIAFALFMTFILYFIITVQTNKKYDNDLVVEEYYKYDVHYSDEMIRVQNAYDLDEKPTIAYTTKGILITFPDAFVPKNIKGNISLYRPSNKKLDFEIPISLSNPSLLILKSDLVDGRWDVNMEWQYEDKEYLTEVKLNIE